MGTPEDSDAALAGRVIAVPETRQLDVLAGLLERRGARVLRCPLVGIVDTPDTAPVVAWLDRLSSTPTDLAVFYTGEGVERLLGFARRENREPAFLAALRRIPKLTRGPKPKRALHRLALDADYEATEPTTAGLVAAAANVPMPHRRVAVQLYNESQDRELEQELRRRGVDVDSVAPYVYASGADDEHVARLIEQLAAGQVDAIAFTSKSQVQRLLAVAQQRKLEPALRTGLARTRVAAVGPIVAAELAAADLRVDAMPERSFTMKPLVTSLCELLGR
jgi:uroporphyrinogen-III synthase